MRVGLTLAAVAAAALCACVPKPPETAPAALAIQSVAFTEIPGWAADRLAPTIPGFKADCDRLAALPVGTVLGGKDMSATYGGKAAEWANACAAAARLNPGDDHGARHFYETEFAAYRIAAPGLITGYYEPEVRGALSRQPGFTVPLLARPVDLAAAPADSAHPGAPRAVGRFDRGKFVPYWTRAQIEAGAMGRAAQPLLWLRSQADLFFLQLQGAGRIRLPDGSVVRVAYDGQNGRTYTPIGRVLVARQQMAPDAVSMQSIKAWLAAHPGQAGAVMNQNDDYVFFRLMPNEDAGQGPPGTLGVTLTAGRSIAVDPQFLPLGVPVFLDTKDPLTAAPLQRLMLAQDTGTDIKGPARADIFFGFGDEAEAEAGRMREAGTAYVLLPRPPATSADR